MFDFCPQEGWHIATAVLEPEPQKITAEVLPIVGWLQDPEGRWQAAIVDVRRQSHEIILETASEFVARQQEEHDHFMSLLVPPGLDPDHAKELLRDSFDRMG